MIPFTQESLQQFFIYEPKTGSMFWRVQPSQRVAAGTLAGSVHPQGYTMVQLRGRIYAAHRLVWKLVYGVEPAGVVDHINGCRSDNTLGNLRVLTRTGNLQAHRRPRSDNKTGVLGVCMRAPGKYQARIQRNGVSKVLGQFNTAEEAHARYLKEKTKTT